MQPFANLGKRLIGTRGIEPNNEKVFERTWQLHNRVKKAVTTEKLLNLFEKMFRRGDLYNG